MYDALVLLSGGLDSAVALAYSVKLYGNASVGTIAFRYGQIHAKEIRYATEQARIHAVSIAVMDIEQVFMHMNNPLLYHGTDYIPEGEYSKVPSTFVPFRNGIFLSIAASYAYEHGYGQLVIAAHQDDSIGTVYPDCDPRFIGTMSQAIKYGTDDKVNIWAPFIDMSKAAIVKKGHELGVNFTKTWSCYKGGHEPCGVCSTCIDRRKAFEANGLEPQ